MILLIVALDQILILVKVVFIKQNILGLGSKNTVSKLLGRITNTETTKVSNISKHQMK